LKFNSKFSSLVYMWPKNYPVTCRYDNSEYRCRSYILLFEHFLHWSTSTTQNVSFSCYN